MTNPYQPIERYLAELERARKEMTGDTEQQAPLMRWRIVRTIVEHYHVEGDIKSGAAAIAAIKQDKPWKVELLSETVQQVQP